MIGLFIHRDTWLHRLPAGFKLSGLAISSVVLYPVSEAWMLLPVLVLVVLGYRSLGHGWLDRLLIVKPLVPMFLLILALQWWTQGLNAGLVMLQRMLILILLANLVTLTTRMDAMMDAVMPLLAPLRWVGVDPARISFAVALLVRFVPVLMAVMLNLIDAWKARGGGRQLWRLAIPMMINAIRLSDHVSEALAARGGVHSNAPANPLKQS